MKHFLQSNGIEVVGFVETRVKNAKFTQVVKQFGRNWEWSNNYDHSYKGRIWLG